MQTSSSFDFPIRPALKNVQYVGPVLDDPDWANEWENPFHPDDKRPMVVIALSTTFQNQKKVIQRGIDALGKINVRGLVTLGIAMENEKFIAPDNVKVIKGASHAKIFPFADCVITHAGHGTIMRALACGVPLVCMPMGRDQGDNAAKIVFHGTGIKISSTSGTNKIAKNVQQILDKKSYRLNAIKLGQKIVEDAKSGDAVKAIESLF
jgi:UDP:flavonoid glycosyltransferase YjiC (YdhE family)